MATKGTPAGKKSNGAGQKRPSTRKQAEIEAQRRMRRNREICGIVFIALGLFFLLSRFPFTGVIGEKLFGFTFGLFGVLANALPFVCMGYGVFVIVMADHNYHGAKSAAIWGIVISVCSMLHLSQSDRMGQGYINYLANSFAWGESSMAGGGIFGALITYYTSHLLGTGGSYLLFATIVIILLIVLGNLSISQMGEKMSGRIVENVAQKRSKRGEAKEGRKQKREAERQERERVEAERARLFQQETPVDDVNLYYNEIPKDVPACEDVPRQRRVTARGAGQRSVRAKEFNLQVGERPYSEGEDFFEDQPTAREEDNRDNASYHMPDYDRFYGQKARPAYDEGGSASYVDMEGGEEYYYSDDEKRTDREQSSRYEDDYDIFLPPVKKPRKKNNRATYVNIEWEAPGDRDAPHHYEEEPDFFQPPDNRTEESRERDDKIVPFPFGKKPGKANPHSFANYDLGEDEHFNGGGEYYEEEYEDDEREDAFPWEKDGGGEGDSRMGEPSRRDAREHVDAPPFREKKRAAVPYKVPSSSLLDKGSAIARPNEDLGVKRQKLQRTLNSFGVDAKVTDFHPGPVITRFEVQLAPGVRMNKLLNLANDIAMNMAVQQVRIAPIPGKAAIGVEVPNAKASPVMLRELVETEEFRRHRSSIAVALGKDIGGKPIIVDIGKMPHLLIAGATGSGKSVCINTILCSFLFKSTPEELKLILVDPKVVELALYRKMPHLLLPVVTQPQKAASALNRSVSEMEERYRLFEAHGVREVERYNEIARRKGYTTIPKLVIVIDELADLMMVAPREVEDAIIRIAQKGRAAGIHLIVATQRPSADIITGLIKSNVPSRIAFAVASASDSRIILDTAGADKLLGKGDMLYLPIGASQPIRMQGALVTDEEIERVQDFYAQQGVEPDYDEEFVSSVEEGEGSPEEKADKQNAMDELLPEVVEKLMQTGQASTSMIQRRFRIGYTRAARIMDQMEELGVVSSQDGSKARNVLINREDFEMLFGYPPDIPPLGT